MEYEVGPEELKAALDAGQPVLLLDVREPWEFQCSHIEGSKLIPMNNVPAQVQELDPGAHVVVICHHGNRSLNVTHWLRQMGFEKAQSLRGGVDAWARRVDPRVGLY